MPTHACCGPAPLLLHRHPALCASHYFMPAPCLWRGRRAGRAPLVLLCDLFVPCKPHHCHTFVCASFFYPLFTQVCVWGGFPLFPHVNCEKRHSTTFPPRAYSICPSLPVPACGGEAEPPHRTQWWDRLACPIVFPPCVPWRCAVGTDLPTCAQTSLGPLVSARIVPTPLDCGVTCLLAQAGMVLPSLPTPACVLDMCPLLIVWFTVLLLDSARLSLVTWRDHTTVFPAAVDAHLYLPSSTLLHLCVTVEVSVPSTYRPAFIILPCTF